MTSKINMQTLLQGLLGGVLALAVLAVIGVLFPAERGNVKFAIQQTAGAPFEYVELAEAPEAVPVNTGRFQLSRILQQLQARAESTFRPLTPRELFKTVQDWHCLLFAGLFCCCMFLRAAMRSRLLFHLYLNAITPCRAGPVCA